MKKIKIVTPENIEVEYLLADVGSRAAAAIIDFLVQGVVSIILLIAILLISSNSPELWAESHGWIVGISLLINAAITYSYFIVMELSMNGVTLGKKVMKLRAIRNNGQPLTLKHSALRNFFRLFIDLYGVGVVSIFISKNRKRIGDYVASTIVVVETDKASPILLNNMLFKHQNIRYYLSEEEEYLLRDYISRKDSLGEHKQLSEELRGYFARKLQDQLPEEELKSFLNSI